jgi:hypothetical protein
VSSSYWQLMLCRSWKASAASSMVAFSVVGAMLDQGWILNVLWKRLLYPVLGMLNDFRKWNRYLSLVEGLVFAFNTFVPSAPIANWILQTLKFAWSGKYDVWRSTLLRLPSLTIHPAINFFLGSTTAIFPSARKIWSILYFLLKYL